MWHPSHTLRSQLVARVHVSSQKYDWGWDVLYFCRIYPPICMQKVWFGLRRSSCSMEFIRQNVHTKVWFGSRHPSFSLDILHPYVHNKVWVGLRRPPCSIEFLRRDFLTKPTVWWRKSRFPYQTGHPLRKLKISLPNQVSGKEHQEFLTKPAAC